MICRQGIALAVQFQNLTEALQELGNPWEISQNS